MFANETTETKALRPTMICEAPPFKRTRKVRTTRPWRKAMQAARAVATPRQRRIAVEVVRSWRESTIDARGRGRNVARWLQYNIERGCITGGTPKAPPADWQA